MKKINKSIYWFWNSILSSTFITFLTFKLLQPFARIDLDRHHDGIMLAPAVAIHEGLIVHRDVNAQYGPITPIVHSMFLNLDSAGSLYAIRLANLLFISLTVFFISDLGRVAPNNWNLNFNVTKFSAITWIVLCDAWVGVTMLPWSSVIVATFISCGLYFLAVSQKFASRNTFYMTFLCAGISGIFVGLSPFTRLNVGLVTSLISVLMLITFSLISPSTWKHTAIGYLIGFFVSVTVVIAYLGSVQALPDFYQQSIIWPRKWAPLAIQGWETKSNLIRMFENQMVFALAVLFFFQIVKRFNLISKFVLGLVFAFFILVVEYRFGISKYQLSSKTDTANFENIRYFIYENYMEFFFVLTTITYVVIFIIVIYLALNRNWNSILDYSGPLLLSTFGIGLSSQIVPTWDSRHIWWGLPLGLCLFWTLLIRNSSTERNIFLNPLMLQICFILVITYTAAASHLSQKREPTIEVQSIARGMQLTAHEVAWLAADGEFLNSQLGDDGKAIFLTWSGYLSVINGRFLSADPFFIVQDENINLSLRLKDRLPVVVEDTILTSDLMIKIENEGYHLTASNGHLKIFRALSD